jgi:hypothetical protein
MTTTNIPNVPVPAGFSTYDWADTETPPWRTIWGPEHKIEDGDTDPAVVVRASALQYTDGTIENSDDESPAVHIDVFRDWGISAEHARQVAAAILEAAEEAERLVAP